ncbi:MAG TPA: glycoside hydrolase family 97 C-terminal domain-containing protein [Bacteroidales bacterium]|nr:glycoside hydrolase family 97 C-terminal domain-containing protein [Bacteroidales bacterium]
MNKVLVQLSLSFLFMLLLPDIIQATGIVGNEIRSPDGRIAVTITGGKEITLVACRNGNDWWVAAMTDWTPRTLELDLLFLGVGKFSAEIYQDGMNADQYGSDYKRVQAEVNPDSKIRIIMAPGGGWVAHFRLLQ